MREASSIAGDTVPRIARLYRFQWEPSQSAFVLLFPEGMVQLNETAGEILRRCNDRATLAEIIADLEKAFASEGIGADVTAFLTDATTDGWIEWRSPPNPP